MEANAGAMSFAKWRWLRPMGWVPTGLGPGAARIANRRQNWDGMYCIYVDPIASRLTNRQDRRGPLLRHGPLKPRFCRGPRERSHSLFHGALVLREAVRHWIRARSD